MFLHAAAGGVMTEVQGGNFGHGFITAGVMKGVSFANSVSSGAEFGEIAAKTVIQSMVGGTVSKLTGGKFANGAVTGAFRVGFEAYQNGEFSGGGTETTVLDWTAEDEKWLQDTIAENAVDLANGDVYAYEPGWMRLQERASLDGEFGTNDTQVMSCLASCASDQFDLQTLMGGTLTIAGSPVLSKPFQMGNASKGTSPASKYLSRAFPQRLKRQIPTPRFGHLRSGTPVVGRAMGRFVPVLGTAILAYDGVSIGICTASCVSN